jgi:hypothetical protein
LLWLPQSLSFWGDDGFPASPEPWLFALFDSSSVVAATASVKTKQDQAGAAQRDMMKIHRRFLIGGSVAALVAGRAARTPLVGRDGGSVEPVGYSVVVKMFGSGAKYNSDGTVSGTPNGAVYSYNPDTPDGHTTASDLGDFVSPFAGFTQGCVHCVRDDTDLHVWFRKDKSPIPARIEIILELGKYRTDGTARNLGPFALQIFQGGTPRNIRVYTISGAGSTWVPGGSGFTGFTNVTTAYFPQMGYWSRWRWNPTPRAIKNTGAQLKSNNVVPNFDQALGNAYGATPGGSSPVVAAYSSAFGGAYNGSSPTNYNPVGVNEPCTLSPSIGGVGDRPELGFAHEAACDWIVNGSATMQQTMLLLAEVDGGMPWHFRDSSTEWAPQDFVNHGLIGWFWAWVGMASSIAPYAGVDYPSVPVPSANGSPPSGGLTAWALNDLFHRPALSYVAYMATGDPFYLENVQDALSWLMGMNFYHRQVGWFYNVPDANNIQSTAPFVQALPLDGTQGRGRAWAIRDVAQAYLATPASVPSWLRPQSYYKSLSDLNQQYLDTWRTNAAASYPEWNVIGNLMLTDADYGLYIWYENIGMGFMINQAGQTNWLPWATFRSQASRALTDGLSGWDNRWTHQYGYFEVLFSTDYGIPSAKPTGYGDIWAYQAANAMYDANTQYVNFWSTNIGGNGVSPLGPPWQPNHGYRCNSWICEFRGGVPVVPNVGDVVSLTISGSFSGSPVTVSHSVTSADNTALINLVNGGLAGTHPITSDLISQINANRILAAAGIKAGTSNTNAGAGSYQSAAQQGRFFISFNSDGTSVGGGPVIGPITVRGTYTPNGKPTSCSLYIQANGDLVRNGTSASDVLYHRALSYQCAQSGTSAADGGPSGTTLQSPTIVDRTCKWCYVPEMKSGPIYAPGNLLTAGRSGFGGPYGYAGTNPSYIFWAMAGLAMIGDAGIPNALLGRTNLKALLDDWYAGNGGPPGARQRWAFAIAPLSAGSLHPHENGKPRGRPRRS